MTYFPLHQTTCFFIPLVAPCKPLLANGEKAPSSILYTDVAGGKTNYLPIRAISELLGISIDYDSATRTVLLDSQDEGDWVADGYNGYVVDPNGEKTEVPHLSD